MDKVAHFFVSTFPGIFFEWLTFSSAQCVFLAHYQISIGSEDWFNYIEEKCQKSLSDYELEMLNEKYTEVMNRYM